LDSTLQRRAEEGADGVGSSVTRIRVNVYALDAEMASGEAKDLVVENERAVSDFAANRLSAVDSSNSPGASLLLGKVRTAWICD
jgi:hypothetical protein